MILNSATKSIIGLSGGKDSMATAILCHLRGLPVSECAYCRVMFDEHTSAEVPEHEQFLQEEAFPKLRKDFGFHIEIVRDERNYMQLHNTPVSKGEHKGFLRGSPICLGCWVQRDLKVRPLEKYYKAQPKNTTYYVGIAKDEENRLSSLAKGNKISLLAECGFTESDAKQLCKHYGLLSPIYDFADRNGCFFCPNAKEKEFKHLRDHHPDLWCKLLDLEKTPGVVKKNYNREMTLSQMEANFAVDDLQCSIFDFI